MKYSDFEIVISQKRMKRYLSSCGGDKRKAQTLYRYNLRLSQETFTVISYYGVARRTLEKVQYCITALESKPTTDLKEKASEKSDAKICPRDTQ